MRASGHIHTQWRARRRLEIRTTLNTSRRRDAQVSLTDDSPRLKRTLPVVGIVSGIVGDEVSAYLRVGQHLSIRVSTLNKVTCRRVV